MNFLRIFCYRFTQFWTGRPGAKAEFSWRWRLAVVPELDWQQPEGEDPEYFHFNALRLYIYLLPLHITLSYTDRN